MSELIDAYKRHLRATGASPETIRGRTEILYRLHRDLPFGLAYASTDELEEWLAEQTTRLRSSTLAKYVEHLKLFYRWADGRWLLGDPAADLARPRPPRNTPRPVTDDQLAIAIALAPEPWRTAIVLASFGGLRRAEIVGVHREHITADTIWIARAKGGDSASVDTHPLVWELVEPRPPGPLCVGLRGGPIQATWFGKYGRPFFASIGMPGVSLHRFRHWYGTTMLAGGADLRTVQEALRHKSVTSTQGYTLVRGGQRRLAIRSLPDPTQSRDDH